MKNRKGGYEVSPFLLSVQMERVIHQNVVSLRPENTFKS